MVQPLAPGLDFLVGFIYQLPASVVAFGLLCLSLWLVSSFFRWFL